MALSFHGDTTKHYETELTHGYLQTDAKATAQKTGLKVSAERCTMPNMQREEVGHWNAVPYGLLVSDGYPQPRELTTLPHNLFLKMKWTFYHPDHSEIGH